MILCFAESQMKVLAPVVVHVVSWHSVSSLLARNHVRECLDIEHQRCFSMYGNL